MSITGSVRVAIDIGGTFTDLQILDEATGATHALKVPTTPEDPSLGLLDGLNKATTELGFAPAQISALMHGTTIATNAVLEGKLATGALLTTDGFQDVLEIGRHARKEVYVSKAEPRRLLIRRAARFGVKERLRSDGSIEMPVDQDHLAGVIEQLRASKVETIAVCLLHAYANAEHERQVGELLKAALPGVSISLSHQVSPEIREFERSSTTVLNALLIPVIARYLAQLKQRMIDAGISAPVYLVQSNGGVTTPETAAEQPVRLLLSGPSGGARAAEVISEDLGAPNLIGVDMGGTSYDVSVVHAGQVRRVTESAVEGCPVRLPMIEIRTIGAGGGSLGRVDESGRLLVGPESAGAAPGPACYGRGGTRPTVTDANVALGRIDPAFFLGGTMSLDLEAARGAIENEVANPLSINIEDAAEGILKIAVIAMAGAIRLSLFEKGLDPKDFSLASFGGAGGLHACETADAIGADRVIFPTDPGTLSAWGMLYADVVHDLATSRLMRADEDALAPLRQITDDLQVEGERLLADDGIAAEQREYPMVVDLRYKGQAYEIQAPLPSAEQLEEAVASFHALHVAQYAHADESSVPEMVTVRLAALGRLARPSARPEIPGTDSAPRGHRRTYLDGEWREVPVHDRASIPTGHAVPGPMIIEEAHSTLLIPPGWDLTRTPDSTLIATRAESV